MPRQSRQVAFPPLLSCWRVKNSNDDTVRFRVVSLSCCDALLSILETGVRWYIVGPGTLRAPDTRVTPPSSRHDRSGPRPSLGSRVAIDAVSQLHGSAPALVTALASPGAVAPDGN